MRYVRYFIITVIALILVTVAFANRQIVSLTILPEGLEPFIGLNALVGPIQMPLYAVVFGGVAAGLIVGFTWEYAREARHRREARQQRQSRATLERDIKQMKAEKNAGRDEVLVLVEESSAR